MKFHRSKIRVLNSKQKEISFRVLICLLLCGALFSGLYLAPVVDSTPLRQLESGFDYHGSFIDELVFSFHHGSSAQWAALVNGFIDIGNELVIPEERSDIESNQWEADAFWGLACSTHHDEVSFGGPIFEPTAVTGWPLNHLELRQAIAMAIDKYELAERSFGDNGLALDHVVLPYLTAWYNPTLPYDYRSGDLDGAKALLDASGFVDRTGDGYRNAPDSLNPVNLSLFYTPPEFYIKDEKYSIIATNQTVVAEYIGEVLGSLGFRYILRPVYGTTLYEVTHYGTRGYHLALIPTFIPDSSPFYLRDLFYSMSIPYTNIFNFDNETVNTLIEALDTTIELDDLQDIVWDIQGAIAENQPLIPLFTRYIYTAHRTDRFEGWINAPGIGAANAWSLLRTRLKAGQIDRNEITGTGGTLDFGLTYTPDTLNPLIASVEDAWLVIDALYSRLVDVNPTTYEAIPNLARSWNVESEGNGLKLTFHLVTNATWHDGTPFSASDVNFTYHYVNNLPGPWPFTRPRPSLDFTSIEVINNVTIVIHTPLDGYFALFDIASQPILPEHIWEGIMQPALFENPRPVGTGPFFFKSRPETGLVFLEYYELYHYGFPGARQSPVYVDVSFLTWLAAGSFVIIMIALAAFWYLRRRPHGFEP